MPDTAPTDTAAGVDLAKAADSAPHTVWEQLAASVRSEILTHRGNNELPEYYSESDRAERFVLTRREEIWLAWPFAGLFLTAAVCASIIGGAVHDKAATRTFWFWSLVAVALAVEVVLARVQSRIRTGATFPLNPFRSEAGSFYLLARRAHRELKDAATKASPQAEAMLAAAEQILPGYEELLVEMGTIEDEYNTARYGSLITGNYSRALQDRMEPVREAVLSTTVDLLAAARIAFASRPGLLAHVDVVPDGTAAVPLDEPATVLTEAAQAALIDGRAKLAAAAQALADH